MRYQNCKTIRRGSVETTDIKDDRKHYNLPVENMYAYPPAPVRHVQFEADEPESASSKLKAPLPTTDIDPTVYQALLQILRSQPAMQNQTRYVLQFLSMKLRLKAFCKQSGTQVRNAHLSRPIFSAETYRCS
jgi:hypothetical protein